jgi:heat shock protein HtpX
MEPSRLSFRDEIAKNKRNSFLLISVVLLILLALVYAISAVVSREYTFIILIVGTIISILYVVISYYKSADIAIASVGAKKATGSQYKRYHDLVEGIALASGLPKPKLYIMEETQINAFASGRDPQNAVICVTTGTLEKLDKQELEGVIAHEMSHIANYDIRFMTLTAVLVGLISIVSQIFLRSLWFGSGSGGKDDKNKIIFLIIAIALAILAPILVALVQLAISRKREYAADSTAVKFMRTPTGLKNALKKIQHNTESRKKVPDAVSALFLAKPSRSKEWFQTHPPLSKRIHRLEKM